jgi:PAS domain S-box-containing protein
MAWECDKDMRFTWVYNSHFGISDDQLLGKSPADLGFETGMQEFIAHGREVLAHGTGSREIIKHVHADNREEYFDQQIEAVRDVNGNIVGLIGISLDVTERVLAEHRLHKSEESFKLMVAHSGEPMLLVNESGRIECISRMAAVQLGYDDMQLLGTNIERFLDWSGKLDLAMRLKDFLRHAPAPARAVLRVKTGTGSWCWIELEASFVNYGQRPERYLLKFNLINTDISREIRE